MAEGYIDNSVKVRKDRMEMLNKTHDEGNKKAKGEKPVATHDESGLFDVMKALIGKLGQTITYSGCTVYNAGENGHVVTNLTNSKKNDDR